MIAAGIRLRHAPAGMPGAAGVRIAATGAGAYAVVALAQAPQPQPADERVENRRERGILRRARMERIGRIDRLSSCLAHRVTPFRGTLTFRTAAFAPAARLHPGHETCTHLRGVGGAPTGARVQRHPVGRAEHARALAKRPASNNVGRAPFGAPPWRFSAPGSALPSAAFPPQRVQRRSSRHRSYCLAGGFRASRARGYEPRPQDTTPCSAYGPSPEDAPR
jgi:hypothetical protein